MQSLGGPIQHLLGLWISARCTCWFWWIKASNYIAWLIVMYTCWFHLVPVTEYIWFAHTPSFQCNNVIQSSICSICQSLVECWLPQTVNSLKRFITSFLYMLHISLDPLSYLLGTFTACCMILWSLNTFQVVKCCWHNDLIIVNIQTGFVLVYFSGRWFAFSLLLPYTG